MDILVFAVVCDTINSHGLTGADNVCIGVICGNALTKEDGSEWRK